MSGLSHIDRVKDAFISGEPGTTGREPFENSTASGPGHQFSNSGSTGQHTGAGVGHHHNSGESTGQKVKDELTAGSGLSYGQTTGTGLAGEGHHTGHGVGVGSGVTGSSHSHTGGVTGSTHDHSSHSHSHGSGTGEHGLGGGLLTGAAGGAATAVGSGVGHRDHGDRVGNVGQDSAKYEGDLHSAPRTSGAAGTDKFDSDNTHRGTAAGTGTGTGLTGGRDGYADGVEHDTSQRAPGKSSGGLSGLLATSDKDFTGRDRKGEGAYADTDGSFKLNESGPGGNTALTGREGNLDNNPVAQAKSRSDGSSTTGTHGTHGNTTTEPHKEGLVEKVKHAVGL